MILGLTWSSQRRNPLEIVPGAPRTMGRPSLPYNPVSSAFPISGLGIDHLCPVLSLSDPGVKWAFTNATLFSEDNYAGLRMSVFISLFSMF